MAKQLRQRKRVVAEDAILGRWEGNLGPILGLLFGDRGLLFVELLGQGCQMAKFDPFLSLDCAPTPSALAQSKERKGSNFAIWQP